MRRREFIGLIGGAVAFPIDARAQQAAKPVLGVLHGVSAAQWTDRMAGFHRGLGEVGFAEGRNVTVEYRWAEGQFDRLPGMAADLVNRNVTVICAGASDVAIRAAMAATKTIPIVFTTASYSVSAGFVSSLGASGSECYWNHIFRCRACRQAVGVASRGSSGRHSDCTPRQSEQSRGS